MDKKFIKISVSLLFIVIGIIIIGKITFKDMVHLEDYTESDTREIELKVDKVYDKEEHTALKIKIENKSKYTVRIDELRLRFIPKNEMSYSSSEGVGIGINSWDGDINEKTMHEGIKPYSSSFVEFIIPKGFSLDSKYFETEDVDIEYDGSFTTNIPFTKTSYITTGSFGGSYRVGKNYKY